MTVVNPPPFTKIPEVFANDPVIFKYFENINLTIYQLWLRSGGSQDLIAGVSDPGPLQVARLTAIEQRLGSGDALTSDETGFSVDSTVLSVDMGEA